LALLSVKLPGIGKAVTENAAPFGTGVEEYGDRSESPFDEHDENVKAKNGCARDPARTCCHSAPAGCVFSRAWRLFWCVCPTEAASSRAAEACVIRPAAGSAFHGRTEFSHPFIKC